MSNMADAAGMIFNETLSCLSLNMKFYNLAPGGYV